MCVRTLQIISEYSADVTRLDVGYVHSIIKL
jgi:hypothetical protein